jgi:hypothetical protein
MTENFTFSGDFLNACYLLAQITIDHGCYPSISGFNPVFLPFKPGKNTRKSTAPQGQKSVTPRR